MKTLPVKTGMLIRRPVDEVYQAFTEPGVTTWFWFTHADRRISPGAKATWTWAMFDLSIKIEVKSMERDRHILILWDTENTPSEIEFRFEERGRATWVEIINSSFPTDEAGLEAALKAMEGFTLVLAGAKLWLEQAIEPRFIRDSDPDAAG
ncbi:SRPBCC domain-containing protein [Brevundimonas vesicularis]|uniref:SRPBCC domain-containing protein n=1 Tax=Brevundimonas vesicularis TaxID=41276 RepID=UPI0038D45073